MKGFKRFISLGLLLSTFATVSCGEKLSSEQFLKQVRRPKMVSTWTKLKGYVDHQRSQIEKEGKVIQKKVRASADIEVGIVFKSDIVSGEILFDNNEHYEFSQVFASGIEGAVSRKTGCRKGDTEVMNSFNISADDLSLSFLFWDFVEEHPKDSVAMMSCRVFDLKSDSKKEMVRVWIHEGWLAPLKAEWFKKGTDKPYRTAKFTDVVSAGKNEDLHMIKQFKVYGNSWSTMVTFEEVEAEKSKDKAIPKDIFPKLNQKQN